MKDMMISEIESLLVMDTHTVLCKLKGAYEYNI